MVTAVTLLALLWAGPVQVEADVVRPDPTVRAARTAHVVQPGEPWRSLAECESNGRWDYNGGSGFDGGLQFHPGTWSAYKGPGDPPEAWMASRKTQIRIAERVLADQGWAAWPACSKKLGLR